MICQLLKAIALVEPMMWQTKILRWLMALVLVLNLAGCGGEKAASQEPFYTDNSTGSPQAVSKQFSEVPPPVVIQELRSSLEVYQPQVQIVTPKPDEILQDNTVSVRFQVKDLPIFKDSQFDLGPHLHVILDNQPYIAVYDLNQPLVLPDLPPGTHTLRVFASRPWHESFKNEGAYAQTTFHVLTKTDDNNPDPALPLLTYSRPKGSYGAEPILLDFYLTNAPLHLVAKDNSDNQFSNWRIRCTINGESFVFDRWQAVYLKGFKTGKNWVKLEFLDNQGNPVKNAFNSTVRDITYEPKGKDTLSKIVRGELTVEQVRGIVDPNYTAKIPPVVEPAPTPTPEAPPSAQKEEKEEKQLIPETEVEEIPKIQPKESEKVEEAKPKGFLNRLKVPEVTPSPSPRVTPTQPEVIESPKAQPESKPEITPQPQGKVTPEAQSTPLPEIVVPQPEKPKFGGYFNRKAGKMPTPQETVEPTPSVTPTQPEVIESPVPQTVTPQPEITPEPEITPQPQGEVTPKAESTPLPERRRLGDYFNRRAGKMPTPQESLEVPSLPEVIESPKGETVAPQPEITPEITQPATN
jgi:hypothetical protein